MNAATTIHKTVLDKFNNQCKNFYNAFRAGLYLLPLLYVLVVLFSSGSIANKIFTGVESPIIILPLIMDISGLLILIFLFNNKQSRLLIKLAMTTRFLKWMSDTSFHNIGSYGFRLLISVAVFTIIFIGPCLIRHFTGIAHFYQEREVLGLFITIYILSIMICFLAILLPDLIVYKLGKSNETRTDYEDSFKPSDTSTYRLIYWMYYFRSRIIESPAILFVIFPLLLCCLFIISIQHFEGYDIIKSKFTMYGITITFLMASITDLLKSYIKIATCFNDYSNHILRNNIILSKKFKILQIGFGNFGSTIIKTIFNDDITYFSKYVNDKNNKQKIENSFTVIIDRDFELKLLSNSYLILDNDSNKLEEGFSEPSFSFEIGFYNLSDYVDISNGGIVKSKNFGIPGIVADASDTALWKMINMGQRPIIINTTSDHNLPLTLKKLLDQKPDLNPILITTVISENIEEQLLTTNENSRLTSFPINYTAYQAKSITHRLCQLISMIGISKLHDISICVTCHDDAKSDLIDELRAMLYLMADQEKVNNFIMENVTLNIRTEFANELAFNYFPNYMKNRPYSVYFDKFDNLKFTQQEEITYNSIIQQIEKTEKIIIFFIYDSAILSLRLLIETRALIHSLNLNNAYVLTSISEKYLEDARAIINDLNPVQDKNIGFPSKPDDFILRKNLTISNQITAMVYGLTGKMINNNQKSSMESNLIQLEVCLQNKTLELANYAAYLKKRTLKLNLKSGDIIPYFTFNFSYPYLGDSHEIFFFRADFFLQEFTESEEYQTNPIKYNGLISNPSNVDFLKNYEINKDEFVSNHIPKCKNCPLDKNESHVNAITPFNKQTYGPLAYVKIKAHDSKNPCGILTVLKFLYCGKIDFQKLEKVNYDEPAYNIVYETGSLCPSNGEYLHKFYLTQSSDTYANGSNEDSISSVEIRHSNPDKHWASYIGQLEEYVKSLKIDFEIKKNESDFIIARKSE